MYMAQTAKNIANIHKIFTDTNKDTKALIKWHLFGNQLLLCKNYKLRRSY